MSTKIKLEIKNRFTGKVIFEYEKENNTPKETILQAIKIDVNLSRANLSRANLSGADLSGADLSGADLSGADLSGADLSGSDLSGSDLSRANLSRANLSGADLSRANLSGADLSGADLSRANLSRIKFDFFGRMLVLKNEVSFLKNALLNGEVKGSSYTGECSCFMGTISRAKECTYDSIPGVKADSSSDTERWFLGITNGDTPENSNIVKQTVSWIEEFEILLGLQ